MDAESLRQRVESGEDIHTEFKAAPVHPDDIAAELVAFANTDGGELIFGVDDERHIVGVSEADSLMRQVDNVAYQNCEPPITVVQETVSTPEGLVVVVHVAKGEMRPYRTRRGDYFIRTTTGRRRATRQELQRLFQAVESLFFEDTLVLKATTKDIDFPAFARFRQVVVGEVEVDDEQMMLNWSLLQHHAGKVHPTVGGMLLFGREPQRFLPYAYVSVARIPGTDTSSPPSDAKSVEGNLFDQLEDTARFLRIYLPSPHRIHGFEPETQPEIPEEALREFIVNALVHRDYTLSSPVRVFVLDDRIEVHSPGGLPNSVTVEMVKAGLAHVLRNPHIYTFFRRAGLVTDTGNGVRRAMRLVKEAVGAEPVFSEQGTETVVVVPRRTSSVESGGRLL
ncbi:hypothetical protein HRbin16_02816 [bacterium HR16]|nr:hypothetical protein HRbin16_02816 [bacterium HR16]